MTSGNDERHESSCSVHNEPAYPNGPCDCKFREENLKPEPKSLVDMVADAWRRPVSDRPSVVSDEDLDKAVEACRLSDQ